ncbi:hypothetical protein [Stenotrophomonas maltophilia]|uniref:hypothetical protein n=1 Tax=Stenotrophomonas maltophilia TaxID=40324 RepID=UPI0018ED0023|nr:hypothetical protein [Stenotrophomonas maltophilia]
MGFSTARIPMITKDDLLTTFGEVAEIHGCYFCKYVVATYVLYCCVRNAKGHDLAIASKNVDDPEFAASVVLNAPHHLSHDGPTIFEIPSNAYGFTHAMAVPSTYHGLLNRIEKRTGLFLCLPIFRCEFNGNESAEDFKWSTHHIVDVNNWHRTKQPKISVYFDNPRTGGGTDKDGATVSLETLIAEIDNVSGVSNGFIEITNYRGEVIEALSPAEDHYVLIRNRQDEEAMDRAGLVAAVETFTIG